MRENTRKCWILAGSSPTPQEFAQVYFPWSDWLKNPEPSYLDIHPHFFVAPTWFSSWTEKVVINTCLCKLSTKASQDSFGVTIWHQSGWWGALLTLFTLEGHIQSCNVVTTRNPCSLPLIQVMLYKICQLKEGRAQFSRACFTRRGFARESSCWVHSLAAAVANLFLKPFAFLTLTRYCLTV